LETGTPPPDSAGRDFSLGIEGFTYQDLHRDERLADLDRAFLEELRSENAALHARLVGYRADPASFDPLSRSRLLVDAARPVGAFVRSLRVEKEWREQGASSGPEAVLFRFRRDFLQRRVVKAKLPEDLAGGGGAALREAAESIERDLHPELPWQEDPELATPQMAAGLLDLESDFIAAVRQKKIPQVPDASRARASDLARRALGCPAVSLPRPQGDTDEALLAFLEALLATYALWSLARMRLPELAPEIRGWTSFHLPEPMNYSALVETERPNPASGGAWAPGTVAAAAMDSG
jgi:hypothetical protein